MTELARECGYDEIDDQAVAAPRQTLRLVPDWEEQSALSEGAFVSEADFDLAEPSAEDLATAEIEELISDARSLESDSDGYHTDMVDHIMEQALKSQLLTPPEEIFLAKQIEAGNQGARDRMVQSNLRLVISIAKHFRGHDIDFADLIQEGQLGLISAVDRFDWRKGYKFSTYGTWWIRQACQRIVANQSRTIRAPVHVHERQIKLNRVSKELTASLGREPTQQELADAAKISPRQLADVHLIRKVISLNKPVNEDGDELGDLMPDSDMQDQFQVSAQSELRASLNQAMQALTDTQRQVLTLYYGLNGNAPMTHKEVARVMGISRSKSDQLLNAAQATLKGDKDFKNKVTNGTQVIESRHDFWKSVKKQDRADRLNLITMYMASGKTRAEIAGKLGIAPNTVRQEMYLAYKKLGINMDEIGGHAMRQAAIDKLAALALK